MSIIDIANKVIQITNGGLDIITELYPQADIRQKFKIREEHTPSASLKRGTDGRWRLTDYGGDIKNQDCFGLYALEKGLAYYEAILEVGRDIQNRTGAEIFEDTKNFYKYDFKEYHPNEYVGQLNQNDFNYRIKEFSEYELSLLGPFVKDEHCKKVNLYSLEEYCYLNKEKGKVFRFIATEKFPILAFIHNMGKSDEWVKIYMPCGSKKKSDDGKDRRFRYLGGLPKGFVFGLSYIEELYQKGVENAISEKAEAAGLDPALFNDSVDYKLDRICIATGGSDALNLISLGELTIWLNSESQQVDNFLMKKLKSMAREIINIPDNDATGKNQGRKLALEYLDMKTLWLGDYFERKTQKDFKDFVRSRQHRTITAVRQEIHRMLDNSIPAQFWNTIISEKGKTRYEFNHMFGFYFLRLNGFCRIDDKSKMDGYYFARINGHIVQQLKNTQEIKDYFKNFLCERQKIKGAKEIPFDLINMIITSQKMTDGHLANMHNRKIDFTDFGIDYQDFFIGNRVFRVQKSGASELSDGNCFVLENQLINKLIEEETEYQMDNYDIKKFQIDTPYFSIAKNGDNLYNIEIKNNQCDFLNYLIQVSRIHWNKERDAYINAGYTEDDFYEKTKFKITSNYLTQEENQEQMNHLVNKIYTFGYSAHRFKDPSRPWVVFAADNAVIEDDVAEGGAGKSLFFESMRYFMCRHDIDGKTDIDTDKFLFEGVTQHTDFVLFDDVRRNFKLETFFSAITSKLIVNEKYEAKVSLAFRNSPKFGVSTNYAIREQSGSFVRRRLMMGFSDYYHASNEERNARTPKDDFHHNLFLDWDRDQWFVFINFVFQSLQFYLSSGEKIEAPAGNMLMRAYLSEMGNVFIDWAENYIPNNVDKDLLKDDVLEDMRKNNPIMSKWTSNAFKKKTNIWCKMNNYEFQDRIIRDIVVKDPHGYPMYENGVQKKQSKEHIRFSKIGIGIENINQPDIFDEI